MHDLALCYVEGRGVKPNPVEAQQWLSKASKAGYNPSRQAIEALARARKSRTTGSGVRQPITEAQALAAIGLIWAFSQMMNSPSSGSSGSRANDLPDCDWYYRTGGRYMHCSSCHQPIDGDYYHGVARGLSIANYDLCKECYYKYYK